MKFRCAGIQDTLDGGLGWGLGIFFQGCSIKCPNSQNPELQDPAGGYDSNTDTIIKILENSNGYYNSVVFLGGEPTDQEDALLDIATRVNIPCVLFTGKYYETLNILLKYAMYMIVDGPYIEELKSNKFPASYNQSIYIKRVKQ